MGNQLISLAKYCDCFEQPWEYQQQQEEQSDSRESKTNSLPEIPSKLELSNLEIFQDKDIIFNKKVEDGDPEILSKVTDNENPQPFRTYSSLQKSQTSERTNEMEMIDLQKINPLIKAEAYQRSLQPKIKQYPLHIENHQQASNESENMETLSNLFQQQKGKYFIQNDEVQFYRIDQDKAHGSKE